MIYKAFKFELKPKGEHLRKFKQFCGMSRFVFNQALATAKIEYEFDNKAKFSYTRLANLLPKWKIEHPWLKECHSQVLQQSLKDLESAYKKFFKKPNGFPKFKKKGLKDSFRFPQGFKLDEENNRIYLPKIGFVRYRKSQQIQGLIKNVTVSLVCGKWFVSIQTEFEQEEKAHKSATEIGVDMGISRFATLSDGTYFKPLNTLKTNQNQLTKLQRKLSRKKKLSQNWLKCKRKLSKLHHKIANTRKDYLHKISHEISKNHAMIYIEDLKVSNMSKSAKGNEAKHGKNVKAKSGLNKAILDQGWSEFRRQLEYKSSWVGGFVHAVDPKYTRQTCPHCAYIAKENRKTQALFECISCGYKENADVVGALNILRVGHTRRVCEVNGAVMPSAAETLRSELALN